MFVCPARKMHRRAENSAFGALSEASGAFRICGANISGRRYFARCAEMNFMEKGPAEKQVLFLKTNPNFNTNAPPFEIRGCKVILGGAYLSQGVQRVIPNPCANSSKYVR